MVHRILVALLLIGSAARAKAAFGSRGQVVPFGGIGYSHTSVGNADANSISLAPGAMWFPTNNVAIGGQVVYAFNDFGASVHSLGFEPLVGFGVPLADHLAFFPRVGMQFLWAFAPAAARVTGSRSTASPHCSSSPRRTSSSGSGRGCTWM